MAQSAAFDKEKGQKFLQQVMKDVAASFHSAMSYIGDRLGIFKVMAKSGPVTAAELAHLTGLQERYLQEWLGSMVAARYIEYDPATSSYTLPPEHVAPLADEDSPVFLASMFAGLLPHLVVAPKVAEAFRKGGGVSQSEYPEELFAAMERMTAPMYKHYLIQQWLPALPEVSAKLSAGGSALDVGCGSGLAAIKIAQAFPEARVFGFDRHSGSVERARANARAAGLGESRIRFDVADCNRLPHSAFDFVTTFEVVHDAVDPLALITSIRHALRPGGTYMMAEVNASAKLEDNINNPMGRMLYSASTLYCMTTSLAEGGAGLGAAMGEPKARELAASAGFGHFRRLPIDHPFAALYELKVRD
jgi:2-polyprenyl-3-methyl-5-hydroxy-6-metoxy-1,4-benzoquinol methylase